MMPITPAPLPKICSACREPLAEPVRLPHSLIRLNHVDAGYVVGAASAAGDENAVISAGRWASDAAGLQGADL